jgi:hypothetical protein
LRTIPKTPEVHAKSKWKWHTFPSEQFLRVWLPGLSALRRFRLKAPTRKGAAASSSAHVGRRSSLWYPASLITIEVRLFWPSNNTTSTPTLPSTHSDQACPQLQTLHLRPVLSAAQPATLTDHPIRSTSKFQAVRVW